MNFKSKLNFLGQYQIPKQDDLTYGMEAWIINLINESKISTLKAPKKGSRKETERKK